MKFSNKKLNGQVTGLFSPYLESIRNKTVSIFINNNTNILDIGCGRAPLLKELISQGKKNVDYFGLDYDSFVIEQNKKKYPDYQFFYNDILQTDFPLMEYKRFDFITLVAFIEHVPDPVRFILKIKEYLKQNGKIIMTTPRSGTEFIYGRGSNLGLFSKSAKEEHIDKFFSKKKIQDIVKSCNMRIIRYKYFLFRLNQLIILSNQ